MFTRTTELKLLPHIFLPRSAYHTPDPNDITRKRRATLFTACLIAIIIALVALLFDTFKGYHVQTISPGVYHISVNFDRDDATTALKYMDKTLQDTYLYRDVRLPDGTLVPTVLDRTSANNLLRSDQTTATYTTTWRLTDYTDTSIDEDQGIATIFIRLSYREIESALESTTEDHTDNHLIRNAVPLPNGKFGSCWLTTSELKDYRRRMHCIGATSIYLPFTWNLNSQTTASIPEFLP